MTTKDEISIFLLLHNHQKTLQKRFSCPALLLGALLRLSVLGHQDVVLIAMNVDFVASNRSFPANHNLDKSLTNKANVIVLYL